MGLPNDFEQTVRSGQQQVAVIPVGPDVLDFVPNLVLSLLSFIPASGPLAEAYLSKQVAASTEAVSRAGLTTAERIAALNKAAKDTAKAEKLAKPGKAEKGANLEGADTVFSAMSCSLSAGQPRRAGRQRRPAALTSLNARPAARCTSARCPSGAP